MTQKPKLQACLGHSTLFRSGKMRYYPVNLDIAGRNCLVVGGGGVASRKAATLLNCGAAVTVISPRVCDRLDQLAAEGVIRLNKRPYDSADLEGMFLVIGATDDEEVNRRISQDAEAHRMLCNIADRPGICNFILPSIVRRGDLVLTISTSGSSPAFAKKMRQSLESQFGEEYADLMRLMAAVRKKLLSQAHAPEAHKPLFEALANSKLIDWLRDRETENINALLRSVLGPGFTFQELMSGESGPLPDRQEK
jgi:precorrin-2 dehydrogenase/sirohydrochlorin ferrochelatase